MYLQGDGYKTCFSASTKRLKRLNAFDVFNRLTFFFNCKAGGGVGYRDLGWLGPRPAARSRRQAQESDAARREVQADQHAPAEARELLSGEQALRRMARRV